MSAKETLCDRMNDKVCPPVDERSPGSVNNEGEIPYEKMYIETPRKRSEEDPETSLQWRSLSGSTDGWNSE